MQFSILPWAKQTNIYEVNLRQYTNEGTIRAFMAHLPRLKDMGVKTLWFMPITPISILRRKGTLGSFYAASNYTKINPEFGNDDDFKELVNAAHELGLKVIMDWVANHTGADHIWTVENPDFYLKDNNGNFFDKNGWDDVIDLDYRNIEMREAMINAMKYWVNTFDIDGFRCDMAMLTPVDFWKEARIALDSVKPLFWFAECDQWNNPEHLEVFDAAYTWEFMKSAEGLYNRRSNLEQLISILRNYEQLEPKKAMKAWFTSNHDENSWNGTEYEKYGSMAALLAVFSCTWNGVPLLYSGQEIPNTKRLAFFDKDALFWDGGTRLHEFYKKLLELHSQHPALTASKEDVFTQIIPCTNSDKVFMFKKTFNNHEVVVMLNLSPFYVNSVVHDKSFTGSYHELFTNKHWDAAHQDNFQLREWDYKVWVRG